MTSEILVRRFSLDRAEVDETTDGRTLDIRAVPWDTAVPIAPNVMEEFDPGAFDAQVRAAFRLKLTLGHPRPGDVLTNSLIGNVVSLERRDDGLHVRARVTTTTVANDALQLINDQVLDQVSIGFRDLGTKRTTSGGVTTLRRTRAHLDHLAVVGAGAYGEGARVLAVRDDLPGLAELREWAQRLAGQ